MQKPKMSSIIEDKHNNSIIMLLYLCGRKSKTEIYDSVSSNPRMPYKLQLLEDEGIITVTKEKSHRERSMVDLTPLGVKYAEGLCSLEASMDLTPLGVKYAEGLCSLEASIGGDVEALRRGCVAGRCTDELGFEERQS